MFIKADYSECFCLVLCDKHVFVILFSRPENEERIGIIEKYVRHSLKMSIIILCSFVFFLFFTDSLFLREYSVGLFFSFFF